MQKMTHPLTEVREALARIAKIRKGYGSEISWSDEEFMDYYWGLLGQCERAAEKALAALDKIIEESNK